jgi:hypothetical protein
MIVNNLIGINFEIALSIWGPFNKEFCYLQLFTKNVFAIQLVNTLFAMTLVKYVSIFVLKNPTRIDIDFWSFFVNVASLANTLIFQTGRVQMHNLLVVNPLQDKYGLSSGYFLK